MKLKTIFSKIKSRFMGNTPPLMPAPNMPVGTSQSIKVIRDTDLGNSLEIKNNKLEINQNKLPQNKTEYFDNFTGEEIQLSEVPIQDSVLVLSKKKAYMEGEDRDYVIVENEIRFNYTIDSKDMIINYKY